MDLRDIDKGTIEGMLKRCSRCHEVKPLDEFYRVKRNKDGHCCYCKKCEREKNSAWLKAHRDEVNKRNRERYASDPERRKKSKERSLRWRRKGNWPAHNYEMETCRILVNHHDRLKEDGNRLTTEFIMEQIEIAQDDMKEEDT